MKLSIITVNYNNRDGLQKTIDSVISQTWRDFEWIIIDGGSTDGSKELIEKYQSNFAYWCSEPDKGVYNAMNKGIAKAKGEYISCMNSGDIYYENDTLNKVFYTKRTADILYGDAMKVNGKNPHLDHFAVPVEIYTFFHRNVCHQAMFVRTQILKEKGFDESYRLIADYSRWIEAAINGNSFEYINVIVCSYDTQGMSTNWNVAKIEVERMVNTVYPKPILLTLQHLDYYESNKYFHYTKFLLEKHNIISLFIKFALAFTYKLYYLKTTYFRKR